MSRSHERSIAGRPEPATPPSSTARARRGALHDWGGVRNALTWTHIVVTGALPILAALVLLLLGGLAWDRDRRVFHRIAAWWGAAMARTLPFTVERRGFEAASGGPFVIVANHQSMLDLLVLYLLPLPYRTLVRRSLFYTPIGMNMWAAGYLPTPRRREGEAVAEIERLGVECKARLARGLSVLIFPEGSRAHGRELLRFRRFAFDLAAEAAVPVLPVALTGTNDIAPPTSWRFAYDLRILMEVLPAIPSEGRDSLELMRACRETLVERVAALRDELKTRYGQGP